MQPISVELQKKKNSRHMAKTNKMTCAPSEDLDQPLHPPSLIKVFTVHWVAIETSFLQARIPRLFEFFLPLYLYLSVKQERYYIYTWAATWQNQQSECAPSKDSDLRCPREESLGPYLPMKRTTKTDQTGRMPRLIWVFAGRTLTLLVLSCRGSHILLFLVFYVGYWFIFDNF